MSELEARAREIAEFLGIPEADAIAKLSLGFIPLHHEVTADFRRVNPQNDAQLLEWYRATDKYIFELTAYHLDPGYNYSGMCEGIATRLKNEFPGGRVLCLGDGIGDLSLAIAGHGMRAAYHDLLGSRTELFAAYRISRSELSYWIDADMVTGWAPDFKGNGYDAVVSLDFLEHCIDVEGYVRAIYAALKPGGLLCSQNAFGCGSGEQGSIPMHLARNDRFVTDWDPLLSSIGFRQESSNWYRRP